MTVPRKEAIRQGQSVHGHSKEKFSFALGAEEISTGVLSKKLATLLALTQDKCITRSGAIESLADFFKNRN